MFIRKSRLLLIIIPPIVIGYYLFSVSTTENKLEASNEIQKKSHIEPIFADNGQLDIGFTSKKVESGLTTDNTFSDAQLAEISNWRASKHGYIDVYHETADYHNYSLETLHSLSLQNDFIATHILAFKYIEKFDDLNTKKIYQKAALLGSTFALLQLGSYSGDKAETKHQKVINLLSYHQAAILRGDRSMSTVSAAVLEHNEIKLTAEDKALIRNNGLRIISELEKERQDMGLDRFDNSVPELVSRYFDNTTKEHSDLYSGESAIFVTSL